MKRLTSLIFLVFILGAIQLNAQGFKAYLALGASLAEADLTESGNSQVGSRPGLNVGAGVSTIMNKRCEVNMELLYSQNGAYVNPVQVPSLALNKIRLDYVEVPLTVGYRFNIKKDEEKYFYKRSIYGGIGYARLFKHKVIAVDDTNVTDDFRFDQENALLLSLGATSFFTESFALNGKCTFSTFGDLTIALRLFYYI